MTDNKGLGSKAGASLPPIPATTQPLPAQPAPAAPSPAAPAPSPAAPTPVTPAASPTAPSPAGDSTAVLPTTSASAAAAPTPAPTAAPAAHVGRRRRRPAADHHVTPAPATSAPADDETEGSEETEQVHLTREEAIAAAKKEILEEAAAKKEKKKLKNRAKRAPKAFLTWLGKWCKKHWFITAILVVAIIASLTVWVNGKFADDNSVASSEPRKVAPARISPGTGGERAEDSTPTIVDDGDGMVLTYTDPSFSDATFDVIVDNDLNIIEVRLGETLKEEYGGRLSIGTTNTTEDDVRCTKTSQSCDFSKEKISICKSWLWLNRSVHNGPQSSNGEQPYWSPVEVFDAQLDPSRVYPGDTDTTPQLCGVNADS